MTAYTVNKLEGRPQRKVKAGSKASRYPFDQMTNGTGFYISADQVSDHHHCRVAASNYNKQFGTNIRCNLTNDGRLQVWMDGARANASKVINAPGTEQHPTKFEFVAWLNGMQNGTAVYIPEAYASRYDEFTTWVNEWNKQVSVNSIVAMDGARLKITKG